MHPTPFNTNMITFHLLIFSHCTHAIILVPGQRSQPGDAKNTYGTGAFMLLNTGETPILSTHGLITTIYHKLGKEIPTLYALEGKPCFFVFHLSTKGDLLPSPTYTLVTLVQYERTLNAVSNIITLALLLTQLLTEQQYMRLRFCGSGWVWIYVAVPKCWLAGRAPRG